MPVARAPAPMKATEGRFFERKSLADFKLELTREG
jgi:hypothetical protein